jgi:hypothetical protein
VLDVGRVGGGHGGEEGGVDLGDEARKLRRHPVGKARGDPLLVGARRAALGLRAPRRRGKDDVAVVGHGTIHRGHKPAPGFALRQRGTAFNAAENNRLAVHK